MVFAANEDERQQALMVGAAVALHGLLAGGAVLSSTNLAPLIKMAFDLAEGFLAEAERRGR